MTRLELNETVGQVVARQPALAPVFERHRIDYCCGGKRTLAAACQEAGRDPQQFLEELLRFAHETERPPVDPAVMTLTDLADHIEQTHQHRGIIPCPACGFQRKQRTNGVLRKSLLGYPP